MSVQAITRALEAQGLPPSEKFLLVVLANYANPKMVCWPSAATLAHDTCFDPRTIKRLLKSLEARGLIRKTIRMRGKKAQTSNLITLRFDGGVMPPPPVAMDAVDGGVMPPEPKEPLFRKERVGARDLDGRAHAQGSKIQGETGRVLFTELAQAMAKRRTT